MCSRGRSEHAQGSCYCSIYKEKTRQVHTYSVCVCSRGPLLILVLEILKMTAHETISHLRIICQTIQQGFKQPDIYSECYSPLYLFQQEKVMRYILVQPAIFPYSLVFTFLRNTPLNPLACYLKPCYIDILNLDVQIDIGVTFLNLEVQGIAIGVIGRSMEKQHQGFRCSSKKHERPQTDMHRSSWTTVQASVRMHACVQCSRRAAQKPVRPDDHRQDRKIPCATLMVYYQLVSLLSASHGFFFLYMCSS